MGAVALLGFVAECALVFAPSLALDLSTVVLAWGVSVVPGVVTGVAAKLKEAMEARVNKAKMFFMTVAFRFFVSSAYWECLYNACQETDVDLNI